MCYFALSAKAEHSQCRLLSKAGKTVSARCGRSTSKAVSRDPLACASPLLSRRLRDAPQTSLRARSSAPLRSAPSCLTLFQFRNRRLFLPALRLSCRCVPFAPSRFTPPPCRWPPPIVLHALKEIGIETDNGMQVLFTVIYVVPFYLSPATRPSPQLTRDAPSSIRARVRAVTFSCLASVALTIYVLHQAGHVPAPEILRLLGFWPVSLLDIARSMLLVAILFAGPLFEYGIVDGGLKDWIRGKRVYEVLSSWIGYRNYVVVCHSHLLHRRRTHVPRVL